MMAAVVASMTLGELLGAAAGAHSALEISDLVSDSRRLTPGAAFVALAGERSHGLDFADAALAAGASIVLYEADEADEGGSRRPERGLAVPDLGRRIGELGERFYGRGRKLEALVGVTGTNGKTTVAWLVAQALTELDGACGYIGTLGYGVPGHTRPHALTTPDCLSLHRELAELATSRAAIEVSSHALEQDRIAGLEFTTAAFTNLSRDHLDRHGTMEAYFEAKARLFARPELESIVVNSGDPYAEALIGRKPATARAVSVALGGAARADVEGQLESRGLSGLVITVNAGDAQAELSSPLIGGFNAENLLVALGVLVAGEHALDQAAAALARARPAPGRMEVFGGAPGTPWVIVDYAHTPAALERVLQSLNSLSEGEITCVFGCGGERDRGKRALMGAAAARYAAHIVLTDDNPRGEDPRAIVADIKAGIGRHGDLRVQHDRERAIREAITAAGPGNLVLVAGKGHETVQLTADGQRAFDDRAIVAAALEGKA